MRRKIASRVSFRPTTTSVVAAVPARGTDGPGRCGSAEPGAAVAEAKVAEGADCAWPADAEKVAGAPAPTAS